MRFGEREMALVRPMLTLRRSNELGTAAWSETYVEAAERQRFTGPVKLQFAP